MLGTTMVCAMLEVVLSFVPKDKIRRMFPNIVTGVAVMLIGAGLTATGIKYWGGGAVCAEMAWKNNPQVYDLVGIGRPTGTVQNVLRRSRVEPQVEKLRAMVTVMLSNRSVLRNISRLVFQSCSCSFLLNCSARRS